MISKTIFFGFCFTSLTALGVLSGCAGDATTNDTGASADSEVRASEARTEYRCELSGGRIVELHPGFGELHRIGLNEGTWQMEDGLQITEDPTGLTVKDAESGEEVAKVTASPASRALTYREGKDEGSCTKFSVKKAPFQNEPFPLGGGLEYSCTVGSSTLTLQPEFGEIEIVTDGKLESLDGLSFSLMSLESFPPQNLITVKDEEGTKVGSIHETAQGAKWTADGQSGSCTKSIRTRL